MFGASRHHCRATGQLICQTCMVVATKESHVVEMGVETQTYLAPETRHIVLERPVATSMLGNAYEAMSSAAHVVKFCKAAQHDIALEHQAFRQAAYLLGAMRFFAYDRQRRIASIAVRAYLAQHAHPTGMATLGCGLATKLQVPFYTPKVRPSLVLYDRDINFLLSKFFRNFLASTLDKTASHRSSGPSAFLEINSIFEKSCHHNHLVHVFLACMLNGAHMPSMRADLVRYVLSDEYRALHILLARRLGYDVRISLALQLWAWKTILLLRDVDFLIAYPCLLAQVAHSATHYDANDANNSMDASNSTAVYDKFISMVQTVHAKSSRANATKLLCQAPNPAFFQAMAKSLGLDDTAGVLWDALVAKLTALVVQAERLDGMVHIPWTLAVENAFAKLPLAHPMIQLFAKIYAHEPRTLAVEHVVSSKTFHVARLFQSFLVYVEPNAQCHAMMRHVFDVATKASQKAFSHPLYSHAHLNGDMVVLPGNIAETQATHVDKNTFSTKVECTLVVLVTVLLVEHLKTFVHVESNPSLNLVEVANTSRNLPMIASVLTFNGIHAIKTHILGRSLHAMVVDSIGKVVSRIMQSHLPEFYMGLLGLDSISINDFLTDLGQRVNEDHDQTIKELVLTYLV